jgi:hypothetical protein
VAQLQAHLLELPVDPEELRGPVIAFADVRQASPNPRPPLASGAPWITES